MSSDVSRPQKDGSDCPGLPGGAVRTVVSLLILIHCFCVFIVLSANGERSLFQARLVEVLAPYTGLLNLDPDFVPYYLTHGLEADDDYAIEIELDVAGSEPQVIYLPQQGLWPPLRAQRWRALARVLAAGAQRDDDAASGRIATALGGHAMDRYGAARVVVRCVRHEPMTVAERAAANRNNSQRVVVYEADVIRQDGETFAVKRDQQSRVAPVEAPGQ